MVLCDFVLGAAWESELFAAGGLRQYAGSGAFMLDGVFVVTVCSQRVSRVAVQRAIKAFSL